MIGFGAKWRALLLLLFLPVVSVAVASPPASAADGPCLPNGPQYPPTTGQLTLSTSITSHGLNVSFAANCFEGGASVAIDLHSSVLPLTSVIADSVGTIHGTFVTPNTADLGDHTVSATGANP